MQQSTFCLKYNHKLLKKYTKKANYINEKYGIMLQAQTNDG